MSRLTLACKIVLLGEGGVGKTSLRRTYMGQNFSRSYNVTIGADFAAQTLKIDDSSITANIWDLSGQMKFKIMRETYYRGVTGAILVYDIARRDTFERLSDWVEELTKNNNGKIVPILLIANKQDLRDEIQESIPTEDGIAYAQELSDKFDMNVLYIEASAKTGENVQQAFEALIMGLYEDFKAQISK